MSLTGGPSNNGSMGMGIQAGFINNTAAKPAAPIRNEYELHEIDDLENFTNQISGYQEHLEFLAKSMFLREYNIMKGEIIFSLRLGKAKDGFIGFLVERASNKNPMRLVLKNWVNQKQDIQFIAHITELTITAEDYSYEVPGELTLKVEMIKD